MKVGVILLCRFSSSRLPGKIMREIGGRPIIDYIVERILTVVDKEHFTIATSDDVTDDRIEEYCKRNNLNCFRGSLSNVSKRFLECALHFNWDYALRINGDNFFVETDVMKHFIDVSATGQYDFLSNTHNKTFPQGMSVESVRVSYYKDAFRKFSSEEDFEHVTYYMHHLPAGNFYYYDNTTVPGAGKLKFAIDEQKDFDLCARIFSRFTKPHVHYKMKEIIDIYKSLDNE